MSDGGTFPSQTRTRMRAHTWVTWEGFQVSSYPLDIDDGTSIILIH